MSLIIETDLGHDPDDFFTILWLIASGQTIKTVVISPGDPDQIAVAHFIQQETGHPFTIGAAKLGRSKLSSGGVHYEMLDRYGYPLERGADDHGSSLISRSLEPDDELLVIAPLQNVGHYLADAYGGYPIDLPRRATMQGGFCPYTLHRPPVVLEAFEGKDYMPTFNLNGDVKSAQLFLNAPFPRQMVGKNVCHTVVLDPARVEQFAPPPNRAAELFMEAARLLKREKKFHDPVAALCHLRPEIGTWFSGNTVRRKDGWTTVPGGDKILVDLDRDAFWNMLYSWGQS